MKIIECPREDLVAIQDIRIKASKRYNDIVPGFMDDLMTLVDLQQIIDEGTRYFCAIETGQTVGFIGYLKTGDTVMIRGLFVLPEYQRKSVGTSLLSHFESIGEQDKARRILLLTLSQAHWATSFYLKHGFYEVVKNKQETIARYWKPLPEKVRAKHPDVPMSLMEKQLDQQ